MTASRAPGSDHAPCRERALPSATLAAAPRSAVGATLMTVTVLAAVGTPLFPGFFALLATITRTAPLVPVAAIVILVVWMLWAWAGARITRGFVVGPPCEESRTDISGTVALLAGLVLVALGVAGVGLSGYLV